jgi:hypothetical protein
VQTTKRIGGKVGRRAGQAHSVDNGGDGPHGRGRDDVHRHPTRPPFRARLTPCAGQEGRLPVCRPLDPKEFADRPLALAMSIARRRKGSRRRACAVPLRTSVQRPAATIRVEFAYQVHSPDAYAPATAYQGPRRTPAPADRESREGSERLAARRGAAFAPGAASVPQGSARRPGGSGRRSRYSDGGGEEIGWLRLTVKGRRGDQAACVGKRLGR